MGSEALKGIRVSCVILLPESQYREGNFVIRLLFISKKVNKGSRYLLKDLEAPKSCTSVSRCHCE